MTVQDLEIVSRFSPASSLVPRMQPPVVFVPVQQTPQDYVIELSPYAGRKAAAVAVGDASAMAHSGRRHGGMTGMAVVRAVYGERRQQAAGRLVDLFI